MGDSATPSRGFLARLAELIGRAPPTPTEPDVYTNEIRVDADLTSPSAVAALDSYRQQWRQYGELPEDR